MKRQTFEQQVFFNENIDNILKADLRFFDKKIDSRQWSAIDLCRYIVRF